MIGKIERIVFAHSIINPPSFMNSCDVNLNIVNPQNKISLKKEGANLQTKYLLTVLNPSELGLCSSEQSAIDDFIKNLVRAMNLNLNRTALSFLGSNISKPQIEFQPHSDVKVKETPKGKLIEITETVFLRDEVHTTMQFSEDIDETKVLSTLELINKLNKLNDLKSNNLKKALRDYDAAMSYFDRLMIFKNLFNCIEKAVCWDGDEQNLDGKLATITGFPESDIKEWRKFYARTKHVDRKIAELTKFINGMKKLPNFIGKSRVAANSVLMERLNQLSNV